MRTKNCPIFGPPGKHVMLAYVQDVHLFV